mmetsp:Transcript_9036/g.28799  ORF Transcript_9036/g.28799 Transcript_9036/m.28799 type:complete len:319 (+) Transcript_9036:333-1289(+)
MIALVLKVLEQPGHLKERCWSLCVRLCWHSSLPVMKAISQLGMGHLKRLPLTCVRSCERRLDGWANRISHLAHRSGFSPVCVRMCTTTSCRLRKYLWHLPQMSFSLASSRGFWYTSMPEMTSCTGRSSRLSRGWSRPWCFFVGGGRGDDPSAPLTLAPPSVEGSDDMLGAGVRLRLLLLLFTEKADSGSSAGGLLLAALPDGSGPLSESTWCWNRSLKDLSEALSFRPCGSSSSSASASVSWSRRGSSCPLRSWALRNRCCSGDSASEKLGWGCGCCGCCGCCASGWTCRAAAPPANGSDTWPACLPPPSALLRTEGV